MVTAGGPLPEISPDDKIDPDMKKMLEAMVASGPEANTVEAQISSGQFTCITAIRDRRVFIADQQKGLAVGFSNFYHDRTVKEFEYKSPTGETEMRPSWQGAMPDLYPADYLTTPTPILPPTITPTRTPSWP